MAPSCSMQPGVRLVLTMPALVMALTNCSRTESHSSSASATASASPGAATSSGSTAAANSVPKRGNVDCAHFLSRTLESSKSLKMSMWAEPGSWGALNSALQRLPPGAELCGATHLGDRKAKPDNTTVFVRSSLYGDDLKKFWDPIMTAAGCTLSKNEIDHSQSKFVWRCPNVGAVTVITDLRDEIYGVGHLNL